MSSVGTLIVFSSLVTGQFGPNPFAPNPFGPNPIGQQRLAPGAPPVKQNQDQVTAARRANTKYLPPLESLAERDIADWIQQLAAPEFSVRRAAMRKLQRIGVAAKPLLFRATKSHDVELRQRAEDLLADLRYGIRWDMPQEMQSHLRRFRDGDSNAKSRAFQWLIGNLEWDDLKMLILSCDDARQSGLVRQLLMNNMFAERFKSPDDVVRFVNQFGRQKTWRSDVIAAGVFSPRLLAAWVQDGRLEQVKAFIRKQSKEDRERFATQFFNSGGIRSFLNKERDDFAFLTELLSHISAQPAKGAALTRFLYDQIVVDSLFANKHWDEYLAAVKKLDDASRFNVLNALLGSQAVLKKLLEIQTIEEVLKFCEWVKEPGKRGQMLARLFSQQPVHQHLLKKKNMDLVRLIAEREPDAKVRREYLKVLLQAIRYRSDIPKSLTLSLWKMVKADEDSEWKIDTILMIIQSTMGQNIIRNKDELKWVLELIESKEALKKDDKSSTIMRYLVQNSNVLQILLQNGHFERIWTHLNKMDKQTRLSILPGFIQSSYLHNYLAKEKKQTFVLEYVENEQDEEIRDAALNAMFNNYYMMSALTKDHLDRLIKLVDDIKAPDKQGRCFGLLLQKSNVVSEMVKQKRDQDFLRFLKADADPEARFAFLLASLSNSTLMQHWIKTKKLAEIEAIIEAEKEEGRRKQLLAQLYSNSQILNRKVKEGKVELLIEHGRALNQNLRRNYLQRLFGNATVLTQLAKANKLDAVFDLFRETTERYQRSSLYNSLIQGSNLDVFIKHKALSKVLKLAETEPDDYARRQMVSYLLNQSSAMKKIIEAGEFPSILRLVRSLDDRNWADQLVRMYYSSTTRKALVKAKLLRPVFESGLNAPTAAARTAYLDQLFQNTSAINGLIEEGYLGDLETMAAVANATKRVHYQTQLYTSSKGIESLIEQGRLSMLLELALNQPNETQVTSLFSRLVGNSRTVKTLTDQGHFQELMDLTTNCSDPTQKGLRAVHVLSATAMLSNLKEEKIKEMMDTVINSELKTVRTSFLQRLGYNNGTATKYLVKFGYFDKAVEKIKADLTNDAQRRTLCSFLSSSHVLEAVEGDSHIDLLFKTIQDEPNSYQRQNMLQNMGNTGGVPLLIAKNRLPDLLKIIENDPNESNKPWVFRSIFLQEKSLRAVVESNQSKLLIKAIKEIQYPSIASYFLSSFSNSSTSDLLGDPDLAAYYFETLKTLPASNRQGYVQTLLNNPKARRSIISSGSKDLINECLELIKGSSSNNLESSLYGINGIVTLLYRSDRVDDAIRVAREYASSDIMMLRFATLAVETGRIAEELKRLDEAPEPSNEQRRLRVYLLRASGKRAEALSAAQVLAKLEMVEKDDANPLEGLVRTLAIENRNWSLAAKLYEKENPAPLPIAIPRKNSSHLRLEQLAFKAKFHKLAGETQQADQTLAEIRKYYSLHNNSSEATWLVGRTMLLLGQVDEGIDLLKEKRDWVQLQLRRQQYKTIFEQIGFDPAVPADWLQQTNDATQIGTVAGLLMTLNNVEHVRAFSVAVEEKATRLQAGSTLKHQLLGKLANLHFRHGNNQEAWRIAARVAKDKSMEVALSGLYASTSRSSTQVAEAQAWWRLLNEDDPKGDKLEQIQIIHRIIASPVEPGDEAWFRPLAERALDQMLANEEETASDGHAHNDHHHEHQHDDPFGAGRSSVKRASSTSSTSKHRVSLRGIATTCKRRGLHDLADRAFKAFAANRGLLEYADYLFEREEWELAAKQYQQIWERDQAEVAPLFLAGECLIRAGNPTEGEQLKQEATRACLQSRARHSLVQALLKHDLVEQALPHLRTIRNTAPPEHWEHNDAARLLGIHTEDDFAESAALWQTYALGNLRTNFYFNQSSSYLTIPLLIHKLNAMGAIQAGDFGKAQHELEICNRYSVATVSAAEDIAPLLTKAEADASDRDRKLIESLRDVLFNAPFKHHLERVKQHPDCALLNNNLAWLCAMLDRELDQAKGFAEKAVSLEPRNGGYLDTLAEVHFRSGDVKTAVALEKKAVKLEPDNQGLQQQLERFQQAAEGK